MINNTSTQRCEYEKKWDFDQTYFVGTLINLKCAYVFFGHDHFVEECQPWKFDELFLVQQNDLSTLKI